MNRSMRTCLLAASFCGALVFTDPAAAQQPTPAEVLFDRGAAEMEAGKYATACPAIAESLRLDPQPGALFTLAFCEDKWGHVASAVVHYAEFLGLYEKLPEDKKAKQTERVKVAKTQREKLIPEVPKLTLVLPATAPPGTIVKRGEQVVAASELGVSVPVDPGEYLVTTQAPGGPIWEHRMAVVKGENKRVILEVRSTPAVTPPTPSSSATASAPPAVAPSPTTLGPSGRRVASYAIGGVGIAGLVVGGVMGGIAAGQKGTINQHCGAGIGSKDDTVCDQTGVDAGNGAKTMALGSTIGLAVGAAGMVTAVVLILTEPKTAKAVTGRRVHRLSAGVLAGGPAGVMIGAEGAW